MKPDPQPAGVQRPLASRFYESEHDLRQMQHLLMEGRSRTDDWRYWHVGDLMWGFFVLSCHRRPQEYVRLWHDDAGKLAGCAIQGEDPPFECQVLPEYAGCGIEAEALAWAEALWRELQQRDADNPGGTFVSRARQDDTERIAFLVQHGFRQGDYVEVNLLRSLNAPIAEPAVPDGFQVRAVADPDEISDRAAAEREVWPMLPLSSISADDYTRLTRLPAYHGDLDLVAVAPDGVIAAYVNGWIDPVNGIGDFGPVGARPAFRRQGLTRAVLLEGLRRMQAYGMDRVCVSTGEANAPARRLCESVGFRVVNKTYDYYVEY